MTLLEIIITPLPQKRVELNQSIDSLQGKLRQCCSNLEIARTENTISLIAKLENQEQLEKMAGSNEFVLLWGAIKTLGIKSEIFINGIKSKGRDLNMINLDLLKNGKNK